MSKNICGITFIELLAVLAILGLLCAIAYPSYTLYLIKARRSDGKTALLDLASRMEHYYASNNSYPTTINSVLASPLSPAGWYTLSITDLSLNSYTLRATPQQGQAADTECSALTINQLGVKGHSGPAPPGDCW